MSTMPSMPTTVPDLLGSDVSSLGGGSCGRSGQSGTVFG
jgi:hypothetical protein